MILAVVVPWKQTCHVAVALFQADFEAAVPFQMNSAVAGLWNLRGRAAVGP